MAVAGPILRWDEVNPEYGCYDEWGPLKEVLVGRADTYVLPGYDPYYEFVAIASARGEDGGSLWGRPLLEALPGLSRQYHEELDDLARTFERFGIKVHRPIEMTEEEIGYNAYPAEAGIVQATSADTLWAIGNNMIETAMRVPFARKNRFSNRRQFFADAIARGAKWVAAPTPIPGRGVANGQGYLEGGDIILLGRDILCGVDDTSTDWEGYRWLEQHLTPSGYRVHPLTFEMIEIHLLAQLNIIRPDLGLIYRPSFEGKHRQYVPKFFDDIDFIELTLDEVHSGGADVVMVDEKNVLVASGQPRVAEELSKRGLEPHLVKLEVAPQFSAGIRCCTIILHREKSELIANYTDQNM